MRIGPLPSLAPREIPGLAESVEAPRIGGSAGLAKPEIAPAVGGVEKGGFSNFLQKAVSEIDGKMQTAQAEQTKVLTGESTNLHQAMIAMQEANVAFTLMVEVRNKLVESYQEVMRMQV
ncbi:MAG: flagellar hook-basal body complex protein FliE [Chthoniobacteraceae bacterium]